MKSFALEALAPQGLHSLCVQSTTVAWILLTFPASLLSMWAVQQGPCSWSWESHVAACLAGTHREKVGAEAAPWKYHLSPNSEQAPLCNFDFT